MPLFYFILKNDEQSIADREGEEFPDEKAAIAHAKVVARELMHNGTVAARTWRLQVCDDYLQPCSELLFASADETVARLPAEYRRTIERTCHSTATFRDSVAEVRNSLLEVKTTLARAGQIVARLSAGL